MGRVLGLVFVFVLFTSPLKAQEQTAGATDRTALGVTVYTNGLAMVRDTRRVTLSEGESRLALEDVAARLVAASARLHGAGVRVLERDFEFDVISPQSLLARAEGHDVDVVLLDDDNGKPLTQRGKVLSAEGQPVVMIDGKIWSEPPGILVYDQLPEGLRTRPTLLASVDAATAGERLLDLGYLTEGLDWQADYTIELNKEMTRLDLEGWATITNLSGADYPLADLQLVAGSVQRTQRPRPMLKARGTTMAMSAMAEADMPRRESLATFHLYDVGRRVTLKRNQAKQVALLGGADIESKRILVLNGGPNLYGRNRGVQGPLHPQARVTFRNWKDNPGVPLPAGTARLYQKDSKGRLQFIGEDRVNDTPVNGTVTLTIGRAFDVTAHREQTDFRWIDRKNRQAESAHKLVLANGGDKPAELRVEENLGGEWRILEESLPHDRVANRAVWTVSVPPREEVVLTYRIRTTP
ncbi:DUF4139 domain-containing protein [Magnetospira sp. QH-2]|uniref:DUF4139 domain-containing protein n=1 Tax=Magnetospira sp. (strain QH-2) TaxID=1288970 RepID=UPI0003E8113F|nr:DUF4139 domain-containing protein [Magnetospira sp. QH-2]CCQ72237.1 conserved exported protein of unknown function [Magnetospira sp. QH-2]